MVLDVTLQKRLKEESAIQGLIILISTMSGIFLSYLIQKADSAIESAINLMISTQGYEIYHKWLENHIIATYDLAAQLLFSVLCGSILLAISTIFLWRNRKMIVKTSIKHPAYWLLLLFLLSWIFQPLHSMIQSWGTPSMGITQVNVRSVSITEIVRIQSEIEKLENFRFFGKQYMASLINTGFLFCIWYSSTKTLNITDSSLKKFIKKRAFIFLLITSISVIVYFSLLYLVEQIPLPSRLLSAELSMQIIVTYVTGEKIILRIPGFYVLKEVVPYLYNILFAWLPTILWIYCLIEKIALPYSKKR